MSRIQQWVAGTVVAVLAIVAAGWFLAVAPQKHKASSLGSQAASEEQSNAGLRNRVAALTAQMSAVPGEEASVAAIAAKIPADPELPSYVRALSTIASQTGVDLISIAPGVPTAIVRPGADGCADARTVGDGYCICGTNRSGGTCSVGPKSSGHQHRHRRPGRVLANPAVHRRAAKACQVNSRDHVVDRTGDVSQGRG